jgi:aspartate/tyrosine/aromatic aminotransferase
MEAETVKLNKSVGEESVIEVDIRLQREREEALAREREEALLRAATIVPPAQVVEASSPSPSVSTVTTTIASPNATETKIALELREMREREEELRRLRQRLSKEEADDGFNSIPNTDEGNFSEYGSEEKELSLDGNNRYGTPIHNLLCS